MKFTDKIEKYLVSNQLHLAIDDFLKLLGEVPANSPAKHDANELRTQIIVLAGRFNSLNDKVKLGTINSETSTIEKTSIVNSFVDILNGLSSTYEDLDKFIYSFDEENAWQQAQSDNNIEAYESYFTRYPNGKYLSETQKLITELGEIKHKQENEIKRVAQEEKLRRVQENQQDAPIKKQEVKYVNSDGNSESSNPNPPKSNKTLIFGGVGVVLVAIIVIVAMQFSKSKNEGGASDSTTLNSENSDSLRIADSLSKITHVTSAQGTQASTVETSEESPSLTRGESLKVQGKLFSANKEYYLILQADGNLVIYRSQNDQFIWNLGVKEDAGNLILQADGNLCIYTEANKYLWDSHTNDGDHLILENNGTLNLYNSSNQVVWSSANK